MADLPDCCAGFQRCFAALQRHIVSRAIGGRACLLRPCFLGLLAVFALAWGGPSDAQNPPPFPDFKAKRVKPPKPGERVIIPQIEPQPVVQPEPSPATPDAEPSPDADSPGRYAWFWENISPDLAASGPGRLEPALRALSDGQMRTPRLQALQEIARARGIDILRSTVGTPVSPALVLAVIMVESAGKSDAVSPAGARGLMQLMPATADRFGVDDSFVPAQNIAGGVKYLSWLMKEFGADPVIVLAGYNAGEGAVKRHGGVPPYAETRDYVPKVLAAFSVAKGLCVTPPELITDGCVFAGLN